MISYTVTTAILTLLLGVIWHRKDIFNLIIKCLLLGVSLWGWILVLLEMGYVVKV